MNKFFNHLGLGLICFFMVNYSFAQKLAYENYANVFKPLDGVWKGKFVVLEDSDGQRPGKSQPKNISLELMESMNLKPTFELDVKQTYHSETPYYQTVRIEDTYTENGSKKTVVSNGYNKVENGTLLCVVNKPDEQVVHDGYLEGKNTIIWHRSIKKPLKVEFFKETVETNTYSIIGWGYYGSDDPKLTPKTWFKAVYKRVK